MNVTIKSPLRTSSLVRFEERCREWWLDRMSGTRRASTIKRLKWGGGAAAVLVAAGLFFWLRPTPQPDYLSDPLDDIFDYTLLTDDFNKLPIEERLALISQLVKRMRDMDAGDSILLASFASGIAGAARQQIEENGSRLAVDMWDKYAKDYANVPEEQRSQFLDQTFVDFTKTMEALAGQQRDISDADRINEARQNANDGRRQMREAPAERLPGSEILGRGFEFVNNNVGSHATPEQRGRGQQMLRDMSRHFRGQDIATGNPSNGPG